MVASTVLRRASGAPRSRVCCARTGLCLLMGRAWREESRRCSFCRTPSGCAQRSYSRITASAGIVPRAVSHVWMRQRARSAPRERPCLKRARVLSLIRRRSKHMTALFRAVTHSSQWVDSASRVKTTSRQFAHHAVSVTERGASGATGMLSSRTARGVPRSTAPLQTALCVLNVPIRLSASMRQTASRTVTVRCMRMARVSSAGRGLSFFQMGRVSILVTALSTTAEGASGARRGSLPTRTASANVGLG